MLFTCAACKPRLEVTDTVQVDMASIAQRQAAVERLMAAQQQFLEDLQLTGSGPTAPPSPEKAGRAGGSLVVSPLAAATAAADAEDEDLDLGRLSMDSRRVFSSEGSGGRRPTGRYPTSKLRASTKDTDISSSQRFMLEVEAVRESQAKKEIEERFIRARIERELREELEQVEEDARQRVLKEEVAAREAEDIRLATAFLQAQGFKDVNLPKRSCLRVTYALHRAAELGDIWAVRALLARGADTTQKDSSGRTAAEIAQRKVSCGRGLAAMSGGVGPHAEVVRLLSEAVAREAVQAVRFSTFGS